MPEHITVLQECMVCHTRRSNQHLYQRSHHTPADRHSAESSADAISKMKACTARKWVLVLICWGILCKPHWPSCNTARECFHWPSINSSEPFLLLRFFRSLPFSIDRHHIFWHNWFCHRCQCVWNRRVSCFRRPSTFIYSYSDRQISSYKSSPSISTHCWEQNSCTLSWSGYYGVARYHWTARCLQRLLNSQSVLELNALRLNQHHLEPVRASDCCQAVVFRWVIVPFGYLESAPC